MAEINNIRVLRGGGLDTDSAPEDIFPTDYIAATNLRTTGTKGQDLGYGTNIESNELLAGGLLAGFNQGLGGGVFEDVGLAMCFRYNSAGKNQILIFNNTTLIYSVVYEDLTDSAGIALLPLTPDMWVTAVLINKTYVIWTAKGLEVGYTNLNTLMSGGYGTVLAEDIDLLKPQCAIPITGVYGSDDGQPANFLFGKLPQFICQYVNSDFNYSAWSTRSARMAPYQQNTPVLGSNVSQNNYIIISVYAGSIRAQTLNIACQFDDSGVFSTVKTVTRDYITALPNTTVDVDTEIYEAYDPGTNIYSFAFYNNVLAIPVAPTETDLLYDYLWFCNTNELINGNIAAVADWTIPYSRPTVPVSIVAVGYNPNIAIPAGSVPMNPLTATGRFNGASGSGAGNHKRKMSISIGGSPNTGDTIVIILADIRNANATLNYTYVVPSGQSGNLAAVVQSVTETLPNSNYVLNIDGTYTINFIGMPYYGLQTYSIELFFAGALTANSIATVLDNTTYTGAIEFFDDKDRPFPLTTDNTFIINTPSKAQVNGQAILISITINTLVAPVGAVRYQFLITKAPVTKILETTATTLTFKGEWDALHNTPALAINSGTIGDTYQVTTPCSPADTSHYTNLGDNSTYNTGSYVTNVGGTSSGAGAGQSYAVLPKEFGDITTMGSILAFSLNPLNLFNTQYAQQGVKTVLSYDYAPGDRCTLQYVIVPAGAISTYDITPGTGYTNGQYNNVALTGGTGTGAIANITVAGNVITAVTLVSAGQGYVNGDSLTGTVTGGTGWSISVTALYPTGINYFNMPCIDLAVLGYDSGTFILKLEKSEALTYTGGHIYYNGLQLDGFNVFMRLYSPAPIVSSQQQTVWYETGQSYTITDGQYDTPTFVVYDGGWYYKTRQFADAPKPYSNPPVQVLATDANYSDFYASAYWSKGRPRTYYDVLENTEQRASIITSQPYITGSRVNGLNRFYPANIYGEGDGQCSSSQGAIMIMWQRGNVLVIIQELGVFYTPVNEAYQILNPQLTGIAISEKLLNNGRYSAENIGIGTNKESFWKRFARGGFIAPYVGEPVEIGLDGIISISGKNSKYFKSLITAASTLGKRMVQYYDTFYEEVILCVQSQAAIIRIFPFGSDWNPNNSYVIAPGDFTSVNNGTHSTVAYDSGAGTATYTPTTDYVGNDSATFSFNPGSGVVTVNNCLNWSSGDTDVNPFSFTHVTGQPLSTYVQSNAILVGGINVSVPISISGGSGQYSINGGAFTSTPGTVNNGDSVVVEVLTGGAHSSDYSTTLTISGTSATFTATTAAAGNLSAEAKYGVNIVDISNGSGTISPSAPGTINLASGNMESFVYTTITGGTYDITISGTPVLGPSHTQIYLSVAGSTVDAVTLVGGKMLYSLTLGSTQTDPTLVKFGIQTI